MKSKIKARVVLMAVMTVLVFGSAAATASAPQHGRCNQACNETFNARKAACRTLSKPDRRACEERAKEAHKACLRSCK